MTATLFAPNGIVGGGAVTGSLSQRAMLVDFTAKRWSARRQDKRITGEAARVYRAADARMRGGKDLLWGEKLDAVNAVLNAAYKDYVSRTLPWGDRGTRILSSAGMFDFAAARRSFEAQLPPALDELALAYPAMLAEAQMDAPYGLGDLFDPSQYPRDGWDLAARFGISYVIEPLADASDFRVAVGDAELARMQQEYAELIGERLNGTVLDVVSQIRSEVGHMAEALRGYRGPGEGRAGAFRDSLVGNVRRLAGLLPSLNLTGDAVIADVCARMATELCSVGPETLRASAVERARVVESAESILETMSAYV